MSAAVTRTKILIPRRREDLLRRPRLHYLLDELLDYPFTLISAPAGYGKTSLLIDLISEANYPVCWFSLDKLDRDPHRFLEHLIGCIQIHFHQFGQISTQLVRSIPDPFDQSDQLITTLVNELFENITEHIVIILDDFHLVEEQLQISSFVSKFGQMVDDNIHLVLTSRNIFEFPDIPLLAGRRKIKAVGYKELAFDEEEIKALFESVFKQTLTANQTKKIASVTEGWITGLLLSRDDVNELYPDQGDVAQVTGANIFTYLAEQVFQNQASDIKEFLLQSSIFNEFNHQICLEVLGWPEEKDWNRIINHLIQQNLFVQQVTDNRTWTRYHNLFLDYLRSVFNSSHPDQEKKLLSRLVNAYTQSSKWENAFETAQRLGDAELMAKVIDLASSDLFHSGRIHLLSNWLDQLPEKIFELLPKLQALRGFSKTELGYPLEGLNYLEISSNNQTINNAPLVLAQTLNWLASANRILCNYEQALEIAKRAYTIAGSNNKSSIHFSESLREIGLSYNRLGNLDESEKYLLHSLNSYKKINNNKNIALVHMDLGSVYINQGNLHAATEHYKKSLDIWSKLGNKHQLANLLNNLGYLALLNGDYIKANSLLSKAFDYSIETGSRRMQALVKASYGDLAKIVENYRKANEIYEEAYTLSEACNDGYLQSYLSLSILSIHRLLDDTNQTKNELANSRIKILNNNYAIDLGVWYFEKGLLQLKEGKHLRGNISFGRALRIFKKSDKPLEVAQVQAGQALLKFSAGNLNASLKHLLSASETLKRIGSNQPLLPMLSRHYEEFNRILKSAKDPDLAQLNTELNEFRQRLPLLKLEIFPEQKYHPQSKPILRIQAFGKTQLWLQGKRLTASEWIHQKTVRELFYYLLSLSNGVTKEEIGLVFWPESSSSQLTSQFKNAIYRLRRSVGKDRILYDPIRRSYSFNRNLEYSYDVEEFLVLINSALQEKELDSRLNYLHQALYLYQHPFAADLDGVWTETIRRKLYLHYEEAALELAELLFEKGSFKKSLEICSDLIIIEPCQEQAYQLSFHSYNKMENYIGLSRAYRLCKNNLSHFLGTGPSKKTNEIYRLYNDSNIT